MLHAPVQSRARATLGRVLAATEELLRTRAYADVSLSAIASAAGVTTGAIFARFADKDSLLLALDEWLATAITLEADKVLDPAAWAHAPLEASLERLFQATIRIHRQHAGVIRAVGARRDYPPLRDRLNAANRDRGERVRKCVGAAPGQPPRPPSDPAVDLALLMCVSVIRETIVFGGYWPQRLPGTDRALARELARAFAAQISASPAALRRSPRRARRSQATK